MTYPATAPRSGLTMKATSCTIPMTPSTARRVPGGHPCDFSRPCAWRDVRCTVTDYPGAAGALTSRGATRT
jgi:hypothetical protein